jgi:3-methyladenine DNA glycosylase AlkC
MKLANELGFIVEKFKQLKGIEEYAQTLKESGKYNDFETRLAWDCLRMTVPSSTICEWYEKYDCTDDHITTLAKKALKIVRGENANG